MNDPASPLKPGKDLPFELSSLSQAFRYQNWVYRTVAPFLGSRVLEIGAGIGNMSKWLPAGDRLILTESDPNLLQMLRSSLTQQGATSNGVNIQKLDLMKDDLDPLIAENLDTIVSFNVLEHIEDDREALRRLELILRKSQAPGKKRLVTFVPAHSWAYGAMDREFGHFRRYSRTRVRNLCREARVGTDAKQSFQYFNLFGLPGWIFHGRILNRPQIGPGAIALFEKLCPLLAPFDDFLHRTLRLPVGQSLLFVLEWN